MHVKHYITFTLLLKMVQKWTQKPPADSGGGVVNVVAYLVGGRVGRTSSTLNIICTGFASFTEYGPYT